MMRQSFVVEGDHFQILVGDRQCGPIIDTTHLWRADEAVASVPNEPYIIGLPTQRYGGKICVEVEITEGEPEPVPGWASIGRFRIDIPSGELVLWGPENQDPNRLPSVAVVPGQYSGAAYSRGTEQIMDELAGEGPDEYRIVLWRVGLS